MTILRYTISKAKLQRAMKLIGCNTYEELAAKGIAGDIHISSRNLYKLAAGANYTRQTLDDLCRLLDCAPGDLVEAWHGGDSSYTHGAPQPEEELEAVRT